MLLAVIEDLKRAEPHMGGCHAHEHCGGFDLFAIDPIVAPDDTERPRRRNAEPMHRFAAEIFADGRTQDRTAVPIP